MPVATKKKPSKKSAAKEVQKGPTPDELALKAPPVLGIVPKGELRTIPIDRIIEAKVDPDRLPRPGDEQAIAETARSLREVGQLQPIMVEELADGRFARVFGRRRLAAAKLNGAPTILAIVVPPLDDNIRRTIVAVENIQRQNLTPAEEHLAVAELLELVSLDAAASLRVTLVDGCGGLSGVMMTKDTVAELRKGARYQLRANAHDALLDPRVRARACETVAAMLAKTATWVRDRMYIGRLSMNARQAVLDGRLPLTHAREIAKVADPDIRDQLAKDFAAGGDDSISDTEPGEFDQLQEQVRRRLFNLNVVQWRLDVPVGKCRPCEGCPSNSATNPGLFEHGREVSAKMVAGLGRSDYGRKDPVDLANKVCTDHRCYGQKMQVAKAAVNTAAKKIVDSGKKRTEPGVVKPFVDDAALNERVKALQNRKRAANFSGGSKVSKADRAADERRRKAEQAKQDAVYKLRNASQARAKKFEGSLATVLAKTPGAWAMWRLVRFTKLYQATQDSNDKKAAAAVNHPELAALLQHVKSPSLEGMLAIEKAAGRNYELLDNWNDHDTGIVDKLAGVLGIKVEPAPTLEQFLPAEAKAPAAAKAEKSAKPAKGGKQHVTTEDLDEVDGAEDES